MKTMEGFLTFSNMIPHIINIAWEERDGGEGNEHFQSETNNSSYNKSDIF